jgi:hypothetical protein
MANMANRVMNPVASTPESRVFAGREGSDPALNAGVVRYPNASYRAKSQWGGARCCQACLRTPGPSHTTCQQRCRSLRICFRPEHSHLYGATRPRSSRAGSSGWRHGCGTRPQLRLAGDVRTRLASASAIGRILCTGAGRAGLIGGFVASHTTLDRNSVRGIGDMVNLACAVRADMKQLRVMVDALDIATVARFRVPPCARKVK